LPVVVTGVTVTKNGEIAISLRSTALDRETAARLTPRDIVRLVR
jgi:hypothetical protein